MNPVSGPAALAQLWFRENAARFTGQLLFDEPLSKHTYYRIGGPCAVMAVPKTPEDLHWIAEGIRTTGIESFILGMGSNLLVDDATADEINAVSP